MKLKCLIVDDDPMSRKLLQRHCEKHTALEVSGCHGDVPSALSFLENNKIDLLFLDIEMPGANGFELLEYCAVLPRVIVTSSKEEYAFEAFQYQVDDYLSKPVRIPRFQQAVQKVLENYSETDKDIDAIFIKTDGRLVKIMVDTILFIENVGDYVKFQTENDQHIVYSTLKKLTDKLPQKKFMKVHRSYIVNLDRIVDIEENSMLIDSHLIPVSRANKAALMERLNLI